MRIGIDIADTVIDVWPTIMDLAKKYNSEHGNNPITTDHWVYLPEEYYGWSEEDCKSFWDLYREKVTFSSPLVPNVQEVLNYLYKIGVELYYITAKSNDAYKDLEKNIINLLVSNDLPFDKIILQVLDKGAECKKESVDLLIDDSFDNCLSANKNGIESILVTKPYNVGRVCPEKMYRADSFLDVQKIMQKKLKRDIYEREI